MLPLLSVVVPAYNAEDKIESTLRSILIQDYDNLEIIVVNDASVDGTERAARGVFENRDRPWRIVRHESNRGVSAARNTGMKASCGEYITFVDSDDLVDPDYLSGMFKAISKDNAYMAVCGYRCLEIADGAETIHPLDISSGKNANSDFVKRVIRGDIGIYFGAAMYKKNLLVRNGIRFTEGCVCGEDAEFFIKSVAVAAKIAFSDKCPYVYCLHDKMGSRTGHLSLEQNVKRYSDLIHGRIRAGHYILGHAKSPEAVDAARYELLPRYYLKMFTMHAWRGDKEAFFADLRSPKIRGVILSGRKVFKMPLGILLKSLWLLMFPNTYFEYRRKHVYYYRV